MSRRNVRGIMFAMEDMDTDDVVESNDVDISEVTDGAAELDDGAAVTEDTLATVEPLEEIAETMDEAAEGDGLSVEAAKIADIAIEALCGRLGFAEPKCIYSLESFGSKSSRQAATRIAAEEVWGKVKDTYNNIVKWIKEQIEKLIVFWKKLVTMGPMLKSNLQSTKKKIEALSKTAKPKATSFNDSGLATGFMLATSSNAYERINQTLNNSEKFLAMGEKYSTFDLKNPGKMIQDFSHLAAEKGNGLFGPVGLIIVEEQAGAKGDAEPEQGAIIKFEQSPVKMSMETCPVLNKEQMSKVIDYSITLVDKIASFIKKEGDLRKTKDTAIKDLDKLIGDKDASDEDKKAFRKEIKLVSSSFSSYQKLMTNIPTLSVKGVKAANAYCLKSLGQYDKGEED